MNNRKKFKDMTLRERFDGRGFSPASYAKAYGFNRSTLYDVFKGVITGKNEKENKGDARRIIAQLKKDNVWIGKLPWEK